MKHLILTRFNLHIWKEDKHGQPTLTEEWLRERVMLFETYCLPSLMAQTCKDFKWVILFAADSPEWLMVKVRQWRDMFPLIRPVSVRMERRSDFMGIFREIAVSEASPQGGRMLTTYLDNDDALRRDFVADVQKRASQLPDESFICYRYGIQYFTELGLATSVPCSYNHFPSYVEDYDCPDAVQTFFRLVSHAQMKEMPREKVIHVENKEKPIWLEVVHSTNKYNDVHMAIRTRLITDPLFLQTHFGLVDVKISARPRLRFFTCFIPRYIKQFFRQVSSKLFGIEWV